MKVVAVIPCRNEVKHIVGVVTGVKQYVDDVIVVDDHSSDNTALVAAGAGARVEQPYLFRGYGMVVNYGIMCAAIAGAGVVVLLDGDGQHDPADIPALVSPIREGYADIVMGCRGGKGMPGYRRFGNNVLTAVCNFGAGFKPRDTMTGFWAIKLSALPKLTECGYGLATELLIKVRASNYRLWQVPVKTIYHKDYKDNSAQSPLRLGLFLLWTIIKWRIKVEVLKRD